jgi:hypothetical protein
MNAHNLAATMPLSVVNGARVRARRLDVGRDSDDSAVIMSQRPTVSWLWIWSVATVLSLFSGLQAHRMTALATGKEVFEWRLMVLNFSLWAGPALMAPFIIRLTERFRFDRHPWWHVAPSIRVRVRVLRRTRRSDYDARVAVGAGEGQTSTMSWSSFAQQYYWRNFDSTMVVLGDCRADLRHHLLQEARRCARHSSKRGSSNRSSPRSSNNFIRTFFNTLHTCRRHPQGRRGRRPMLMELGDLLR